ncbi:FAD:protein FMN transferase [Bifidobacterium sp. 82T24]|nr:FAD:protein FMN transferase [Bifidobacterium pluvialisilvae]
MNAHASHADSPDGATSAITPDNDAAATGDAHADGTAARHSSRLPYVAAFPQALGTGIIVTCERPVPECLRRRMANLIEEFEGAFSRFRTDSLVGRIASDAHGGTVTFPSGLGAEPLFALYDRLYAASDGAVDPLVGEELTRLGYGADMAFRLRSGKTPETASPPSSAFIKSSGKAGAAYDTYADGLQKRPTWRDITHAGRTLTVDRPMRLDFGAAGKGMMVDLLANLLEHELPDAAYVVDAGGDLRVRGLDHADPLTIAMEDPDDDARAVGTLRITDGSLCASAPSRRHWRIRSGDALREVHHLLNAVDGRPANDIKATWVFVPRSGITSPTALADGLATALFVADAGSLAAAFPREDGAPAFACAMLDAGRNAAASANFPGGFFTA